MMLGNIVLIAVIGVVIYMMMKGVGTMVAMIITEEIRAMTIMEIPAIQIIPDMHTGK